MLTADADAAYKIVNPNKPNQQHIAVKFTYRMCPLPRGITIQALEDWSKEIKWTFKPLRRVNDFTWVVGAETAVPQPFLSLQGRPVLLEETTKDRVTRKNPIVAGSLATEKTKKTNTDPWQQTDPWGSYKPTTASTSQAAPTRSVQGPAQAALTEQSARMDRFEQELQDMKSSQADMKTQMQQQNRNTEVNLQKLEVAMTSGISELSAQVQKAIVEQTTRQDTKLNDKFDELKALIKERPKRKTSQRSPLKDRDEESDKSDL